MSFFGFEQLSDLENEKRRFLEGGHTGALPEDVAVYTWGEDSYDGLGDALQEGGDDLNDETFGLSGPVGEHSSRLIAVVFPTPYLREGLRFLHDRLVRPSKARGIPVGPICRPAKFSF